MRIVCIWSNGAFCSSISSTFSDDLAELVAAFGKPDLVEFRA